MKPPFVNMMNIKIFFKKIILCINQFGNNGFVTLLNFPIHELLYPLIFLGIF